MDAVKPRLIEGQGTPESRWQAWFAQRQPVPLALDELLQGRSRIVIVAPHPDDEILGCASLLRRCAQQGLPCLVISVTDGGASHPGSTLWPPQRLACARVQESHQALALLAPAAQVVRLSLPDGHIADHAAQLLQQLQSLLRPSDALLCTWREDGHPDHEATGQACATVAEHTGCRLVELPIWAWHWAEPGDTRVPWHRAAAIALSPGELALKRQALSCFRSQLLPDPSTGRDAILPPWATQRLLRPFEVVFL